MWSRTRSMIRVLSLLLGLLGASEGTPPPATDLSDDYYCGHSWTDAKRNCHKACPSGMDYQCGDEMRCYGSTGCKYSLVPITSDMQISLMGGMGDIMSGDESQVFEQVVRDFLGARLIHNAISTNTVEVSKQELRPLTRNRGQCTGSEGCDEEPGSVIPPDGDERRLQTSSSALDVVVIITGEYRPPPHLNLDLLVEDSINTDSAALVQDLQQAPTGTNYFQQVESAEAIAVDNIPTNLPTAAPSDDPSTSPSSIPSGVPSSSPSDVPSSSPSVSPSGVPSSSPSDVPSSSPSVSPSTSFPTSEPSEMPSDRPSSVPSSAPSESPSNQPSAEPSASPSESPSDAPTRAFLQGIVTGSPESASNPYHRSYGVIFNVRTTPDNPTVLIKGLTFYAETTDVVNYEVWTKDGTYEGHKGDLSAWSLIANGSIPGGGDVEVAIPFDKFTAVPILGGGAMGSFYVTLHTAFLRYQVGNGELADQLVDASSPELEVYEGESVLSYPFVSNSSLYRSPRNFLGTIWYDRWPCWPSDSQDWPCPTLAPVSPTALPSEMPSAMPSESPSRSFSEEPSAKPSRVVSDDPSMAPTTADPTVAPTTAEPSVSPSLPPSAEPSTFEPTVLPSPWPSDVPSDAPSPRPSDVPSDAPSAKPSDVTSDAPSSECQSEEPSVSPSDAPSVSPSEAPTDTPTATPTEDLTFYTDLTLSDVQSSRLMTQEETDIFANVLIGFLSRLLLSSGVSVDKVDVWSQSLIDDGDQLPPCIRVTVIIVIEDSPLPKKVLAALLGHIFNTKMSQLGEDLRNGAFEYFKDAFVVSFRMMNEVTFAPSAAPSLESIISMALSSDEDGNGLSTGATVAISVGALWVVLAFCVLVAFARRRRGRRLVVSIDDSVLEKPPDESDDSWKSQQERSVTPSSETVRVSSSRPEGNGHLEADRLAPDRNATEHIAGAFESPENLIGRRLSVRFSGDKYFSGVILSYDPFTRKYLIRFDDGDKREYSLEKKTILWESAKG